MRELTVLCRFLSEWVCARQHRAIYSSEASFAECADGSKKFSSYD